MASRLLVADDSATIQRVVALSLGNESFEIIAAHSGEECLAKARELRPDVVVLDHSLPRKSGYEVAQEMKQDAALRSTPVLLLLGAQEPADPERVRRSGAEDTLQKPFDSQALIDKLHGLLGHAAPRTDSVRAAAAAPRATVGQTLTMNPPWPGFQRGAAPAPAAQPSMPATTTQPTMPAFRPPPAAATPTQPSMPAVTPPPAAPSAPPWSRPQAPAPWTPPAPSGQTLHHMPPPLPKESPAARPDVLAPPPPRPAPSPASRLEPIVPPPPAEFRPPAVPIIPPPPVAPVAPVAPPPPAAAAPAAPAAPPPAAAPRAEPFLRPVEPSKPAPPPFELPRAAKPAEAPKREPVSLEELLVEPPKEAPRAPAAAGPATLGRIAPTPVMLAREAEAAPPPKVSPELVASEVRAYLKEHPEVLEQVVWDVVPNLAETLIREELDRILKEKTA
jgi:CheY-like chemotaxis protein